MKRVTIPLTAAVLTLTACGGAAHTVSSSSRAAAPAVSATSQTPYIGSSADTGSIDGYLMTCSTVVDSDPSMVGLKGSSLTAEQIISYLEALMLADGVVNIPAGTPSQTDTTILDAAKMDLENYHGDQLADDAEQFGQDEESYNPDGPPDTSYASALTSDIAALMKDCPGAAKEALNVLKNGQVS